MNRAPNPLIHAATAKIPTHRGIDLLIARLRRFRQQRRRGHNLSRLAISTLRNLLCDPRPLYRMRAVRRQALDRRNLFRANRRYRSLARAHSLAIKVHRARAAKSHSAAVLRAGQVELVTQHPEQRSIRSDFQIVWTVVDDKMNGTHGGTPEERIERSNVKRGYSRIVSGRKWECADLRRQTLARGANPKRVPHFWPTLPEAGFCRLSQPGLLHLLRTRLRSRHHVLQRSILLLIQLRMRQRLPWQHLVALRGVVHKDRFHNSRLRQILRLQSLIQIHIRVMRARSVIQRILNKLESRYPD